MIDLLERLGRAEAYGYMPAQTREVIRDARSAFATAEAEAGALRDIIAEEREIAAELRAEAEWLRAEMERRHEMRGPTEVARLLNTRGDPNSPARAALTQGTPS